MKVTVEISLYPLQDQFEEVILEFIEALQKNQDIEIEVNGLSTQVFGELNQIFPAIQKQMQLLYEKHQAVLILKMANGILKKEGLQGSLQ